MDTSPLAYQHALHNMQYIPVSGEAVAGTGSSGRYAPLFWMFRFVMRFFCRDGVWNAESRAHVDAPRTSTSNRSGRRIRAYAAKVKKMPTSRRMDIYLRFMPAYIKTRTQFTEWVSRVSGAGRIALYDMIFWSARRVREAVMACLYVFGRKVLLPPVLIGGLSGGQLPPDKPWPDTLWHVRVRAKFYG